MLAFPVGFRIHLAIEAVDMRKSFNGLWAEVEQRLRMDPRQGAVYAFSNRAPGSDQVALLGRFRGLGAGQALGKRPLYVACRDGPGRTTATGVAGDPDHDSGGHRPAKNSKKRLEYQELSLHFIMLSIN